MGSVPDYNELNGEGKIKKVSFRKKHIDYILSQIGIEWHLKPIGLFAGQDSFDDSAITAASHKNS